MVESVLSEPHEVCLLLQKEEGRGEHGNGSHRRTLARGSFTGLLHLHLLALAAAIDHFADDDRQPRPTPPARLERDRNLLVDVGPVANRMRLFVSIERARSGR